MKWVICGLILLFLLFYLAVFVSAAVYDPGTGKKLPAEGRFRRVLLALSLAFQVVRFY